MPSRRSLSGRQHELGRHRGRLERRQAAAASGRPAACPWRRAPGASPPRRWRRRADEDRRQEARGCGARPGPRSRRAARRCRSRGRCRTPRWRRSAPRAAPAPPEQVGGHRAAAAVRERHQAPGAHRHRRAGLEDPEHVQEALRAAEVHDQQRAAARRPRRSPTMRATRGRALVARDLAGRARRTTRRWRCRRTRSRPAPPTSTRSGRITGPFTGTGTSGPPRMRRAAAAHLAVAPAAAA